MTAFQILKAHLKDKGFDGLVCSCIECGCGVDDLAPCGGISSECEPAFGNSTDGFYPAKIEAVEQTLAPDVCPVCAGKRTVTNTHGVEQFCIPCDGTGQSG